MQENPEDHPRQPPFPQGHVPPQGYVPQQPQGYPQHYQGYPQQPMGVPPLPQRPRRRSRLLTIGGIIGGLVLVCCIAGVIFVAAGANSSTPPGGNASTSKPTATPNPSAGLAAYTAAVQPDTQIVSDDLGSVGTDCGARDLTACDSDLQTLSDDVHRFQSDLDAQPAPPCLKSADTDLHTALQLLDKGAQSARAGIKQNDPTMIDTGSSYFSQGTRYIKDATDSLKTASC